MRGRGHLRLKLVRENELGRSRLRSEQDDLMPSRRGKIRGEN